ncbi:F-box protein At1g67340-like [Cynara cardunculus var. scolymus]|uniref:F-box domain, cyclin-like protein n=1 Tax=Cynara cardunculus var. scolymus TaxID=59895 RepID=A0A118JXL5_CYNCS|nr:F-box protein At1g67340-like [Cynara cardunculus var. scolymus]KVH95680.1 F-box domain, cyclin-like protein [Cynara cardunculus var. scolymus]
MRTRRGTSYPVVNNMAGRKRNDRSDAGAQIANSRKRLRSSSPRAPVAARFDFFDKLPNDIVLSILARVVYDATCPADFLAVSATCKRLNDLGFDSSVLSKASPETFAVKAKKWSESAHRFLKRCSDAGNADASYTLGMIEFYCFQNWSSGASLMAKAALDYHAPALYSLAVIQFNGSGGGKKEKDLRTGVSLCARAAYLGHIDALRELGHCLQDGYGVRQNIPKGRRILVHANGRELDVVLSRYPLAVKSGEWLKWNPLNLYRPENAMVVSFPLLSDFGWNVPPLESHPANRFLAEWFAVQNPSPLMRMCSHAGCGRPETRIHEFRRCSVCGVVNYCSRACQALDWKFRHRRECRPRARFMNAIPGGDNVNVDRGNQ